MGHNAKILRHRIQRKLHRLRSTSPPESPPEPQSQPPPPPPRSFPSNINQSTPNPTLPSNDNLSFFTQLSRRISILFSRHNNPAVTTTTTTTTTTSFSSNDARIVNDQHSIRNCTLYAAAQQVHDWLTENWKCNADKTMIVLDAIANVPTAVWLDNSTFNATHVRQITRNANKLGQLYQLVIRRAPELVFERNPHSYRAYLKYIQTVAKNISKSDGIIVLEPGTLLNVSSMQPRTRDHCLLFIYHAVLTLKACAPNARIYIDAGNSYTLSPALTAMLLKIAGVTEARGFSLNVGYSESTHNCLIFAQNVRQILGNNVHFVVDTSLNGVACNSPQDFRKIGESPKTNFPTDDPLLHGADAFLWVTPPGVSNMQFSSPSLNPQPIGKFSIDLALQQIGSDDD